MLVFLLKRVRLPDISKEQKLNTEQQGSVEEMDGKLHRDNGEDKLMHDVLEGSDEQIADAKLLKETFNQGVGAFVPDLMFQQMVSNYKQAKQLFGETIIRQLSGYSPGYVEKNVSIPEFQRELKKHIQQKIKDLQKKNLLDRQGMVTDHGVFLASLSLYIEELDHLQAVGALGQKQSNKASHYGAVQDFRDYRKGDRYRDLFAKMSVRTALRRGHQHLEIVDLKTYTRQSKGKSFVVYALDASGSMKGKKLAVAKRSGVALAYKAIQDHDEVGLLVFGKEVITEIPPTNDFSLLLHSITTVRASQETNFVACLRRALQLFPETPATKHILLLTDAMPTAGDNPEEETLNAVAEVVQAGITVSVVGIGLDENGKALAEKMVVIGNGRFYLVGDLEQLDQVVLMDYAGL